MLLCGHPPLDGRVRGPDAPSERALRRLSHTASSTSQSAPLRPALPVSGATARGARCVLRSVKVRAAQLSGWR